MHQQKRAFYPRAGGVEIFGRAVAHVDDVGFDAARRCGGRPSQTDGAQRKFYVAEQFETRVAFAPAERQLVFFGVHLHACRAKRRAAPLDGARHLRRARNAAADFIGQTAQVFLHR